MHGEREIVSCELMQQQPFAGAALELSRASRLRVLRVRI